MLYRHQMNSESAKMQKDGGVLSNLL